MNPKNAYLAKQKAEKDAFMHRVECLVKQYMADTLQITLNQTEGWGFEHIMRLMDNWENTREEFRPALNPMHDAEADVYQEHIDRILTQIINGKMDLIPWRERYPDLKEVKYK